MKPRQQPNVRLKEARESMGWSVEELADALRVVPRTVKRWEQGERVPPPKMREKLRNILQKDAVSLGFGPMGHAVPTYFLVPYNRNPYFSGREGTLEHIYDALEADEGSRLPLAVCGLGGVGKTQVVVEYAYRYVNEYQAIFWTRGGSEDQLVADYSAIATLLDLPEKQVPDQLKVVEAVRQWLNQHSDWLLIVDNVENLSLLARFLPLPGSGGVLLTTQTQLVGAFARKLALEKMEQEESVELLLRRVDQTPSQKTFSQMSAENRNAVPALVRELDGLPLALDQARAYIEVDKCEINEYLMLYQQRRAELLKRRGTVHSDHPDSVTTTFQLAFDKIDQIDPAATELLRCCAFLQPDAIPEEVITLAPDLGPLLQPVVTDPLRFHDTLQILLSYSLIQVMKRDTHPRLLSIHRLVQAVLQDMLDSEMQRQWAERVVRAVDQAYENIGAYMVSQENRYQLNPQTELYDPHGQECARWIERWDLARIESVMLLFATGTSLFTRALYTLAEPLLQQALTLCERVVGQEHPLTANYLAALAAFYQETGQFDRAETFYQRALEMFEHLPGHEQAVILNLSNLGQYYTNIGSYSKAQRCLERALALERQTFGPEHPVSPEVLHNLSVLHLEQGQVEHARALQEQEFAARQTRKEAEVFSPAQLIHAIQLDMAQEMYKHAESLCRQLQNDLDQAGVPPEHLYRAELLRLKAQLCASREKYAQAEKFYRRALHMFRTVFDPDHARVADVLADLAGLLGRQKQYPQAQKYYEQALALRSKAFGSKHFLVAQTLMNLGIDFQEQKRFIEAESRYMQAQDIIERTLGAQHEFMGYILYAYCSLLEETGRWEEASQQAQRLKQVNPGWKGNWFYKKLAQANRKE